MFVLRLMQYANDGTEAMAFITVYDEKAERALRSYKDRDDWCISSIAGDGGEDTFLIKGSLPTSRKHRKQEENADV